MGETGAHDETGSGRTNSSEGERGRAYGATENGASPMTSEVSRAHLTNQFAASSRPLFRATKYQRRSRRTVAHDRHRPRRTRLLRIG